MWCSGDRLDKFEKQKSSDIDKALYQEKINSKKELKILLLGMFSSLL